MLKILRKGAVENPWFYRSLVGVLAAAFIVTMGWGFGLREKRDVVALVNSIEISRPQFEQTKQRYAEFFRNASKGEEINEDLVKNAAINDLVDRELWLAAARAMGLSVSDAELIDAITNISAFHREGKFSSDFYRRLLAQSRLTPAQFERAHREDLLMAKAKALVAQAAALTPQEIEEAKKNAPKETGPDRAAANALEQKRQRLVQSFGATLRAKSRTVIHRELL